MKVKQYAFGDVITDVTSKFNKVPTSEYSQTGRYAIVDQGKNQVAGYTDNESLINLKLIPIIIFGDHTKILKFVFEPIALGADGAKALFVNPEIAYDKYVYYYLKTAKIKDAGYSRHFKFLKEINIPIPFNNEKPDIDAQIRIATLLSKVENLISRLREQLKQLDKLLKSIFLEMFGDPVRNEKGWEERPLSSIFSIKHGYAFKSDFFVESGNFVLLTPGNFFEKGGFRDRGERQKYFNGEFPKEYILNKSDLLLAMTEQAPGLLGSPLLVPEPGRYLHNQRLGLICGKEEIQVRYLFHFFNQKSIRQIIHSKATGTKVRHTSPTKIVDIIAGYPSIDFQNRFAEIVEKVEGIKSHYQQSLSELDNLYGVLSQKAFKGELDLSRVPMLSKFMAKSQVVRNKYCD